MTTHAASASASAAAAASALPPPLTNTTTSSLAIPHNSGSGPSSRSRLTFLHLPSETQREIISHCSQSDLICVSLVSKHFHELASSQLYRNFHIIFPDEDDINFDSPIDGLAGGLDTLTTSNYNYAKHLKDISMDTLSAGPKGENSYQPYLYSASCGKFLNTLLYLTLKKAKSLEAFRWNIRVELSRPVYRELHRISSLRTLHIRMQAGESYYIPPPPLPVSIDAHVAQGLPNHWPEIPPAPAGSMLMMAGPVAGPPGTTPPAVAGPPPALGFSSKSLPKTKAGRRGPVVKDPSTLSGFRNMRSLSVLDIDDLDIVTELNTCIRNSSSTLTELQLSLSDALAGQARKPPPESDPDDSDVDDEFQVIPVPQPTNYDSSGPAKAFRAQEERRVQEEVLGRIFDIEPIPASKPETRAGTEENHVKRNEEGDDHDKSTGDPREQFVESLRLLSARLMSSLNGSRDFSVSQQDILDTIERAAKKYVEAADVQLPQKGDEEASAGAKAAAERPTDNEDQTGAEASSTVETLTSRPIPENKDDEEQQKGEEVVEKENSLQCGSPSRKASRGLGDEASPDDIDIAHVEALDDILDDFDDHLSDTKGRMVEKPQIKQSFSDMDDFAASRQLTPASDMTGAGLTDEDSPGRATLDVSFEGLRAKLGQFQELAEALGERIKSLRAEGPSLEAAQFKETEAQLDKFQTHICDIQRQIKIVEKEIEDAERLGAAKDNGTGSTAGTMKQYIRDTRGLPLTTLSIHLIPVKASVLSRAVNLSCLKQLTLLNVGNQTPVWTMLTRENKTRPLALRSIFTDHASIAFLTFASQLEELHELFLLERSTKYKPESFAPRSATTIDQIRRLVLKKHMATLKRLMIKDESSGSSWDANEKAMILICTRGRQLEELAVSMNIHAVHAFMQYFSGLVNLRAINILHFRNNDTCIWVVREILRFIVDNLSHHPELKLEWIAMEDDRVDRVVRPSEDDATGPSDEGQTQSKKSKGKGLSFATSSQLQEAFPPLPTEGLDSDSESEDESFDNGTRLRFKTVGPLQFYDVWGVRIFDKEIRSGRL